MKGWGDGEKFADQNNMTDGAGYKELQLTDALRTSMSTAGHWMAQFNKEGLQPFNVTDIVLLPKTSEFVISNVGYASNYNETRAYVMPANVEGYVFNTTNGLVKAYEAGDVVPAGIALILKAAEGTYPFSFTTAAGTAPAAVNQLLGTENQTDLAADDDAYFYGLSLDNNDANVGLYWMNATGEAFTNGAHKAYLKLAKSSAPARFYVFNGENEATGIDNLSVSEQPVKFFKNGQLFIQKDGVVYTTTGTILK